MIIIGKWEQEGGDGGKAWLMGTKLELQGSKGSQWVTADMTGEDNAYIQQSQKGFKHLHHKDTI